MFYRVRLPYPLYLIGDELAKGGYGALSIDLPYHGERSVCIDDSTCGLCLFLYAGPVEGAGFAHGMQGAKSSGMAGAVTARKDLPESGYFNPASYAFEPGLTLIRLLVAPSNSVLGNTAAAMLAPAFALAFALLLCL